MTEKQSSVHSDDQSRETAALYALGVLLPDEAAEFEAHLAGCSACAEEEAAFRRIITELGRAAASAESPPAGLRARILGRIASLPGRAKPGPERPGKETQVWKRWKGPPVAPVEPGLLVLRASEGSWEPTAVSGVSVKALSVDPQRRYVTMLVRMEPSSSYPRHQHGGVEECYVLEGDLRVGEEVLRSGDYQRAEAGSLHGVQSTDQGCLLLIISSQDDELL